MWLQENSTTSTTRQYVDARRYNQRWIGPKATCRSRGAGPCGHAPSVPQAPADKELWGLIGTLTNKPLLLLLAASTEQDGQPAGRSGGGPPGRAVHALDIEASCPVPAAGPARSAGEHTHVNARRTCGRRRATTPANRKLHPQPRRVRPLLAC